MPVNPLDPEHPIGEPGLDSAKNAQAENSTVAKNAIVAPTTLAELLLQVQTQIKMQIQAAMPTINFTPNDLLAQMQTLMPSIRFAFLAIEEYFKVEQTVLTTVYINAAADIKPLITKDTPLTLDEQAVFVGAFAAIIREAAMAGVKNFLPIMGADLVTIFTALQLIV